MPDTSGASVASLKGSWWESNPRWMDRVSQNTCRVSSACDQCFVLNESPCHFESMQSAERERWGEERVGGGGIQGNIDRDSLFFQDKSGDKHAIQSDITCNPSLSTVHLFPPPPTDFSNPFTPPPTTRRPGPGWTLIRSCVFNPVVPASLNFHCYGDKGRHKAHRSPGSSHSTSFTHYRRHRNSAPPITSSRPLPRREDEWNFW